MAFVGYEPPTLRVRDWRKLRGFTLEEVAQRAGLNLHTISRLENRRHTPRPETLEGIAAALGLTPFDLYRDPLNQRPPPS